MERHGSAEWHGGLKDGKGTVSTESGTLNHSPYSFKTRFEEGQGTNPEELIAAAHAGCFSMALAVQLEEKGFKPDSINTSAAVSLKKSADGFSIPSISLQVIAKIPDIDEDEFKKITSNAEKNCPVSKLLNAEITMTATLKK
jgi:lipoyl-dependent peroxiredoxin